MSPHISDLFDLADLAQAIGDGHVRVQVHPSLPLKIINYTERAQYERVWTDVTRQCRGLIVDEHGQVLARPYAKFFNYGEHPEGSLDLAARAVVTDKLDGSLGILYPVNGGHAIATRGSFSSDQALHATGLWQERYAGVTTVEPGITYLFEIIYPGNRIVCDYGDLDDLVLLGGVEIATGMPVQVSWPGPAATVFEYASLGEALKAPPRPGAEGLVVRFPDHGQLMTKIKQSDYVALHRTVTGLNARVVWERLGDGATPAEICEGLPDEFHSWVRDVAAELTGRRDQIVALAWAEHQGIVAALPDGWTRKDYAKAAGRSRNRAWLFLLLDERDPSDKIWRTLRPSSDARPGNYSEDTA